MKRNGVRFLSGILAAVLLLGTTTFCWLSLANGSRVDFPTSFGSAKANYFESGNGSPDSPYLISSPVHLYNLAWLQYLGYFNKNSALTNGRAQSYFKLKNDLVMTGVAIPPIGTAEYPFLGHFDGNGCVVSSLTVSNAFDDLKNVRPTAAVFDRESAGGKLQTAGSKAGSMTEVAIVGLFGVTGDYGALIENGTNTNYATVNRLQYTADSTEEKKTLVPVPSDVTTISENDLYYAAMYVGNFYTDILHIRSVSQNTLIGLAAGYVKGSIENVGVYRADMMLSKDARALDGTVQGIVSKYTLVGDFDADTVGWSENPVTGGKTPGWGGSIDFQNFSRRLNYMITATYNASLFGGKRSYYWNASNYHLNFRVDLYPTSGSNLTGRQFAWDQLHSDTTYASCDLKDGTYLHLNIDEATMFADPQITDPASGWNINAWYQQNAPERPSTGNTGYIVGGQTNSTTTNGHIRVRIQRLNYTYSIYKSFGATGASGLQYDDSKLVLYTKTSDDEDFKGIADSYNGLSGAGYISADSLLRYNKKGVRSSFGNFLGKNGYLYGMRFTQGIDYLSGEDDAQKYQEIDGVQYVKRAINFKIKEEGVITAVVGSYFNTKDPQSMFALYKITRSQDEKKITSLQQVERVYQYVGTGTVTDKYPTVFVGQSSNDTYATNNNYKKTYDRTWFDTLEVGKAYYVEIPVAADSEYAISKDFKTSNTNAYIMYLDIGANGGATPGGQQSKPYLMQSVDFINDSSADENGKIVVPLKEGSPTEHVYPAYADVGLELSAVTDDVIVTLMRASGPETRLNSDGVLEINTVLYYSTTYGGAPVTCITIGKLPTGTDRVEENRDLRPKEDEPAPTSDGG